MGGRGLSPEPAPEAAPSAPGRGRRRRSDGADTARRILQAGVRCFAERGYAGATTRLLAKAAGVNIATLAYHFGGKEGLYIAAIDRLYEELSSAQPDLTLLTEGSPAERVTRLVRFAFAFAREHSLEVRLLLRHVLDEGSVPAPVRDRWAPDLLEKVRQAWELIGLPPAFDWKLRLLTLNHLLVRYAITADADLALFVEGEEPQSAVEEHLVHLATRILLD